MGPQTDLQKQRTVELFAVRPNEESSTLQRCTSSANFLHLRNGDAAALRLLLLLREAHFCLWMNSRDREENKSSWVVKVAPSSSLLLFSSSSSVTVSSPRSADQLDVPGSDLSGVQAELGFGYPGIRPSITVCNRVASLLS